MRILITGGAGLIGTELVAAYAKEGNEIVTLSRSDRAGRHSTETFVQWDGKSIDYEAAGPADVVFNLAGAGIADHRWTRSFKKEILESRLNAASAVNEYIRQCEPKPRVLVSASAVGYYGTNQKKPVDEKAPAGKDFLAQTCVKWEEAARDAGIRTVFTRTGVVLSRKGGAFPRLLTPFQFYAGGYPGDGKQGFPWIHIEDVVGLMRFAAENEKVVGPLNLAAPEYRNFKQFARDVGERIDKPSGLPIPAIAIKAMMGESAMLILEGQLVNPKKALDLGYKFKYATAREALDELMSE